MTTTSQATISEDAFSLVVSATDVLLQIVSAGAAVIHVGSSAPANKSRVGVIVGSDYGDGELREIMLSGLEAGSNIYARAIRGGPVTINFIASGVS